MSSTSMERATEMLIDSTTTAFTFTAVLSSLYVAILLISRLSLLRSWVDSDEDLSLMAIAELTCLGMFLAATRLSRGSSLHRLVCCCAFFLFVLTSLQPHIQQDDYNIVNTLCRLPFVTALPIGLSFILITHVYVSWRSKEIHPNAVTMVVQSLAVVITQLMIGLALLSHYKSSEYQCIFLHVVTTITMGVLYVTMWLFFSTTLYAIVKSGGIRCDPRHGIVGALSANLLSVCIALEHCSAIEHKSPRPLLLLVELATEVCLFYVAVDSTL